MNLVPRQDDFQTHGLLSLALSSNPDCIGTGIGEEIPPRLWLPLAVLLLAPQLAMAKEPTANIDLARQLNKAFVEVVERVSPAVVVINVVQKPSASAAGDESDGYLDSLPPEFRRYFRRQLEEIPAQGQGSGVIIRNDGYILTNGHVVEDAESIEVKLQDGRTFKATVRGVDPQSDVAVVKIEANHLPAAVLGDSTQTHVGEFAIAIGAPFSLDYSVTFGHVSAKGRSNVIPPYAGGAAMDQDFIQTDANINPGNSGGPLVNISGEVIGINTLIRGLHTGIGFAIPSSLAKQISDKLIAEGKFTRAWLGIGIRALHDDAELRQLIKGVDEGVVVSTIQPDGPAAKSDLKPSDIITAVEGKRVSTAQQLRDEIRGRPIGQPVALEVFRNGKTIQVKVKPGEWVEPTAIVAASRRVPDAEHGEPVGLGLTVHPLTHELAKQFGVEMTEGVIVVAVEKNSPAGRNGLKPGDVITAINQQTIGSVKQYHEALRKADVKKGVIVNLTSGDSARFEILKVAEP